MAGEWIAVDLAMPEKPEVQELIDTTGQPVEVVCFRLWKLWGWASMHCTDGSARMTLPRLVRTCGADESFWRAVAAVGWLEIDEAGGSVAVPGWDRRFSQCAKSRMQQSDRSRAHEDRNPGRKRQYGSSDAPASDGPTADRRRGEERRIPPPPREASPGEAWETLRRAWNTGAGPATRRNPWKLANPPDHAAAVIVQDGWLAAALEAIPRLAGCRYFDSPVTLHQFTVDGFVTKVLGGQYDAPKTPKGAPAADERPKAVGWSGSDAARLQATIEKQRATAGGAA
jgi:hypothetical protein